DRNVTGVQTCALPICPSRQRFMIDKRRNEAMPAPDLDSSLLTYTTLGGEVLDLSGLSSEERVYFERMYTTYRAGRLRWGPFADQIGRASCREGVWSAG